MSNNTLLQDTKTVYHYLIDFIISIAHYGFVQIKVILRKSRQLPYIITGSNPYVFSSEGNISNSIYSKIQIALFGWTSLFVVAYVTIASQKIVLEYGIYPKDSKESYIFSTILGVIVFFCDRFILSYPKSIISLREAIYLLKARSIQASKIKNLFTWICYLIYKIFHPLHIIRLILVLFRFSLAIIISSLLVSTIVISSNSEQINIQLKNIQKKHIIDEVENETIYTNYIHSVELERVKYFTKYAVSECERLAGAGVSKNSNPIIDATNSIMDSAYKGKYPSAYKLPGSYSCGISDVRPCRTDKCPELRRVSNKLREIEKEFNEAQKDRVAKEQAVDSLITNKNFTPSKSEDFAGKVEALAMIYQKKYEKENNRFWIEIGLSSPFLLLLLSFELLPAISKMFFPVSGYDRTVAMEELYYNLILTYPKSDEIHTLIQQYGDAINSMNNFKFVSIDDLQRVDKLHKDKDNELKEAIERVFDSAEKLLKSLCSILNIIVLLAIALVLIIFFVERLIISFEWLENFIPPLPWVK